MYRTEVLYYVCVKTMTNHIKKNIRFLIAIKGVGLSLDISRSRKALKSFIAKYMPELKTSLTGFITTVVCCIR